MKIENQVCSLEQAKRLKELGIEQENYSFKWMDEGSIPYLTDKFRGNWSNDPRMVVDVIGEYRAFTVAELGMMLPEDYSSFHISKSWHFRKAEFGCEHNDNTQPKDVMQAPTEAQARAEMLIYLLNNNHTTSEEVNNRLTNS